MDTQCSYRWIVRRSAAKPIHAAEHYFNLWGPILNEVKIDLMICGHTHTAGIHPAVAGKHEFPIVIGGGPKDGKRTVISVKTDRNNLLLNMVRDDGNVIGTLEL